MLHIHQTLIYFIDLFSFNKFFLKSEGYDMLKYSAKNDHKFEPRLSLFHWARHLTLGFISALVPEADSSRIYISTNASFTIKLK